jgi:phytol kinase
MSSVLIQDVLGLGFILISIVVLLKIVNLLQAKLNLEAEVSRKVIHMVMGVTIVLFPWIFSSPTVVWILWFLVSALFMIIRYKKRFQSVGSALYGVERLSYGELYFTLGVALLFQFASSPLLFVFPILILTFSDALAAIIGVKYGTKKMVILGSTRSMEGSFAFFVSSFLILLIGLAWMTPLVLSSLVVYSLGMALLLTLMEAISVHGLDNITLPLGALFLLELVVI